MLIFEKMPAVMSEIGSISKDRTNPVQGYPFRGIDDIYQAFQGVLAKHCVFCTTNVLEMTREERTSRNGTTLLYTILKVQYTFHASDGSNVSCIVAGEAMDSGDKGVPKALSSAMKYCFLQTFCIPTAETKDTECETHEVTPKVKPVVVFEGQIDLNPTEPEPEKVFHTDEEMLSNAQLGRIHKEFIKLGYEEPEKDGDFTPHLTAERQRRLADTARMLKLDGRLETTKDLSKSLADILIKKLIEMNKVKKGNDNE